LLDDQGIFVPVISGGPSDDSKSQFEVECLSADIGLPNLSPDASARKGSDGLFIKCFSNAPSSIGGVDGNGDDMASFGKNDVAQNFFPARLNGLIQIDPESLRVSGVKTRQGLRVVGRLWKGLLLDVEEEIQIRQSERANHPFLIPASGFNKKPGQAGVKNRFHYNRNRRGEQLTSPAINHRINCIRDRRNGKMKGILLFVMFWVTCTCVCSAEMYKWVDEKGTVHFADDLSRIPEKYRSDAEMRKAPREVPLTEKKGKSAFPDSPAPKVLEPGGIEVSLFRRGEIWMAEAVLNGRVRQNVIVDTGASFSLISWQAARELDLTIDENTPFIPVASVSNVILTPLVTLRSLQVGRAEMENVDALIHSIPSGQDGLLGNSFLNKFKVVLDSVNGKMTLFPVQGRSSPDRPGGYGREYWEGRFRFYHRYLNELKRARTDYEKRGARSELNRIVNAVRYFENQLNELERKASFSGVPRHWRE